MKLLINLKIYIESDKLDDPEKEKKAIEKRLGAIKKKTVYPVTLNKLLPPSIAHRVVDIKNYNPFVTAHVINPEEESSTINLILGDINRPTLSYNSPVLERIKHPNNFPPTLARKIGYNTFSVLGANAEAVEIKFPLNNFENWEKKEHTNEWYVKGLGYEIFEGDIIIEIPSPDWERISGDSFKNDHTGDVRDFKSKTNYFWNWDANKEFWEHTYDDLLY